MEISFSHSPSKEYSRLISFKIDWFDLLVVQGTLKRFLQRHNLKASIIWHSALFMFQFSHLYMTTGKTIVVSNSLRPWTAARQPSLSFTISQSLLKLMSKKSVTPSNHLIFCHPFLLLPSIFPIIRVFSNESALRIRRPKHWSFSFSISPSNEYSGLISFRRD